MHLTRDAILEAKDRETVEVDCPEWGGSVLVRGMTGRERDAFEISLQEESTLTVQRGGRPPRQSRNLSNIRAKIVSKCCVDDDGQRLFTDADVNALGEKSGAPVDRIFAVASRLSGLGEQDMEQMAANFGMADGGPSSSASPATSPRPPRSSSARSAAAS
jgi:hypothetical protein